MSAHSLSREAERWLLRRYETFLVKSVGPGSALKLFKPSEARFGPHFIGEARKKLQAVAKARSLPAENVVFEFEQIARLGDAVVGIDGVANATGLEVCELESNTLFRMLDLKPGVSQRGPVNAVRQAPLVPAKVGNIGGYVIRLESATA